MRARNKQTAARKHAENLKPTQLTASHHLTHASHHSTFQPCSQHRALPPLPQGGPSLSSLAHSGRDRSKPPRPCGPQAHPESPGGAVWRATQHCMSTEPCLPQRPSLSSLRRTAEGIGRNPPDRAGLRPIRSAPAARPGQPAHLTHRMSMPLNISPSEATTPHKLLTQR